MVDEIGKLKAPRRRDVPVKAMKIMFRQGVLDKLLAQMEGYQRTLDTHIMIDLRRRLASAPTEQKDALQKLDKSMQDIARHVAEKPTTCDQIARLLQNHTECINQTLQTQDLNREQSLYCKEFLASLHFPEIHSRQEEVVEAHQETFQWIFDDSGAAIRPWANFIDWLKTESDTYWISGKAGSGKSTLMNYIWQDERTMKALKAWAEPKTIICPSFFFWAAGSKLQKTVPGLLRSLLYQIFEKFPNLIPGTTRSAESVRSSAAGVPRFEPIAAWTERRLYDTLQRITRTISSSCYVCLFIDGLDEFEGDHDELIGMIQTIASLPAIKCCVSSRAEPLYVKAVSSISMLRLQDLTRSDIERFVSAKLKAIPEMTVFLDQPKGGTLHPVDLIVKKAEGVFLWVQLAVISQIIGIRSNDDIKTLWRRLKDLPTNINDLYSCMLKRIPKIYKEEAAEYLGLAYLLTSDYDSHILVRSIVLALYYTGDKLYIRPDMSKLLSKYTRVIERIGVTCAGLIYCRGPEEDVADGALDFSNLTAQACWLYCSKARFYYCHGTARNFFDPGQPGTRFVDVHAQHESSDMISAAVFLAELVMKCLVKSPENYQSLFTPVNRAVRFLDKVCYFIARAETSDCNDKRITIEIIHHVDKCIDYVCDWCGQTRDNFWQNVGAQTQKRAAGGIVTGNNFFTFAASSGVYFHVEDRLDREGQSLSHSEIQLLALCVASSSLFQPAFHITSLRQLKLETRLVEMGADANSFDAHTTIWEEALRYIYGTRFNGKGTYRIRDLVFAVTSNEETSPDPANIIETFLQNGADPYPVVHKLRFDGSLGDFFKIDLKLSELPTYRRILERLITAGDVSQTPGSASRLFSPQIYISDSFIRNPAWRSGVSDKLNTFDLNDEIGPQIYALMDQFFDTQGELSRDFKDQIIRQARAIVRTGETMDLESLWGPIYEE